MPESVRDWGVLRSYRDWRGRTRAASDQALHSVLSALGAEDGAPPPASPVVAAFQGQRVALRGEVTLEGGDRLDVHGPLPPAVPPGYHTLEDRRGRRALIVAPAAAPPPPRGWGWAVQLYSLLSRESAGIGDLADLARLGRWAASLGAEVLLVNPLHAPLPGRPQQPSPYYPSSRLYRNPLYLRVPGVPTERPAVIDRDAVYDAKLAALDRLFAEFTGSSEFERYRRAEGAPLKAFATFSAARDGRSATFHEWVQWRLDRQLAEAAREIGLINDLAVGVDPEGADARMWADVLAPGVRVGAPPDEFNAAGQDWGLPAFNPWHLRAARYEPFIRTLRAAFRHARGVRIDHVMGVFRLWWIPPGAGPAEGAYVRYPWRDLLAILALEASRAGAFVVGEDLGTVEPWVRRELRRRGVLSCRVLWFENRPPRRYPEQSLAAVTTHDLPTIAGLWSGGDEQLRQSEIRARLQRLTGVGDDAPAQEVIAKTYESLAGAPSAIVTATLEDAASAVERPNLPGTVDERPNWSLPLPLSLEELETAELPRRIARAFNR